MVPARLINWLKTTYPRPQINPEWLDACYDYLTTELGIDKNDFPALCSNVDEQFLQSSLSDSTLPDTGLPAPDSHDVRIRNTLCEITSITEIGASAFNLKNVRQARIDKEDLAGLAGDLDDGEDYSIPKYPRGMLKMDISDGRKVMRAIEFRRIPGLELGETPLGLKVFLKDVRVRRGIVYLEPNGIQIKGGQTEELEQNQDKHFVRGLRLRMRLPEKDPNERPQAANAATVPVAAPRAAPPAPVTGASRAVPRLVNPPAQRPVPQPHTNQSKALVVDLDPEDLAIDIEDIEDSYSIGDGLDETFEINDAFLQELEQAEQRAILSQRSEAYDSDEENSGLAKPVRVEEVIEISD